MGRRRATRAQWGGGRAYRSGAALGKEKRQEG